MSEQIISSKVYVGIWVTLMCLTVLTATIAFVDLGPFNTVVALVIATFKALLVVLFFMHVKYTHETQVKMVVVAAVFWFLILVTLSLADYLTRTIGNPT